MKPNTGELRSECSARHPLTPFVPGNVILQSPPAPAIVTDRRNKRMDHRHIPVLWRGLRVWWVSLRVGVCASETPIESADPEWVPVPL